MHSSLIRPLLMVVGSIAWLQGAESTTFFVDPMPVGTTATVSFATEASGSADTLLDHDPKTALVAKQGTAQEGKSVSIFLRFPKEVPGLSGVVLGQSDQFGNYVWQQMEFWADTTGNGTYDTKLGSAKGPAAGQHRFPMAAMPVKGLELRVTKQSIKGTRRAFSLNGIDGLVMADSSGSGEMRYVIEDFEDLSSWRTWADNSAQPEGERSYGGYTYLCGVLATKETALDERNHAIGKLRYCFKDPAAGAVNTLRCKRGTVADREAILERISLQANPQGYPATLWFELVDATGRKGLTPKVELTGNAWAKYEFDCRTVAATLTQPLKVSLLYLSSPKGGTGDVLLDDLTVIGSVDRSKRVSIGPIWQGLTYSPTAPLMPSYRLRNALSEPVTGELIATLYSSYDVQFATPVVQRRHSVTLPAYGALIEPVDFGKVPYGHYEAKLTFTAPNVSAEHRDFLAVATLNGKRVNHKAMWIGAQHPADWISDAENSFIFREVVGPLGLDCYRTGAPDKRVIDLGMLVVAGFGGLPKELIKPEDKGDNRGEPTDYVAYEAWVKERAQKAYAPWVDKILAVEYYNEPDLPDFCYKPDIEVFLKMWRSWAKGMRAGAPGVPLGTGGNTVSHGNEKKNFNPRMYTELAKEADVAVWHAHGPLSNFITRQGMVEGWQNASGVPKSSQRLGNSEAGSTSRNTASERLQQAEILVKKIGWAKTQATSLFYTWFTTTDTYDPQGGYLEGENWGLISTNQRLKPSGLAMNELIRNLADVDPTGEIALDPRMQVCTFARADGGRTWLMWPNEAGSIFLLRLAASDAVEVVDMFGRRERLMPSGGTISLRTTGYPMYVHIPKGVTLGAAPVPTWITLPSIIGVSSGSPVSFDVAVKNVWKKSANLAIQITTISGAVVSQATVKVPEEGAAKQAFSFVLPAGMSAGTTGYVFHVSAPEVGVDESLPLMVGVGELVPRMSQPLVDQGKISKLSASASARIVVDKPTSITDLVSDPQTPVWSGADDLSTSVAVAHDGNGISFSFEVKDQTHVPGEAGQKLWTGDSIQVAFFADGKHTEIGLTEQAGGYGFCWLSPDVPMLNKKLEAPLAVTRTGAVTTYVMYLSFRQLGMEYAPGKLLRMTFLINEDDGRGRVRVMKWFDGINSGKNVEQFGFLILQ